MAYYSTIFLVMLAICSIGFASSPAEKEPTESDEDYEELSSLPSAYNTKEDAEDLLKKLKKSFEIDFTAELVENLIEIPEYNPDDKMNEYDFTTLLIGALFHDIEEINLRSGSENGNWESDIATEAITRWKISKESLSEISDLIMKYKKEKNTTNPEKFLENVKNVIQNELEKAEKVVKQGNISKFIREDDNMFDGEDDVLLQGPTY